MIYLENVTKSFGNRELLKINKLEISDGEKVGIVGKNGAGKSTLLNIISGRINPDSGKVSVQGSVGYIEQISDEESVLSGGEKEKRAIMRELVKRTDVLLADEPSSNLDIDGINYLIKKLNEYQGILLLISHDRNLLDSVCTQIIEIENGEVNKYLGNYTKYKETKTGEIEFKESEYLKYVREKSRLESAIQVSKNSSKSMKKTPSRMGNSEARLHKREAENKREKLEGHTKALESRLEKLDKPDRPIHELPVYMRVPESQVIKAKIAISGENVNIKFNEKVILKNAKFNILSNRITALVGKNGAGKTSLINRILSNDENVRISGQAKIGYFSQDLSILDNEATVFQNVMNDSVQSEVTVRNILANLNIKGNDVYKKVGVLSGGERVKVSIAKLLVSDYNVLILDEPTNFLDIPSIEALEKLLREYKGTILLVTHDKTLINNIAQNLLIIEDKNIVEFEGNLEKYQEYKEKKKLVNKANLENDKLLLSMKISEIISKLSIEKDEGKRNELEQIYKELIEKKKNLLL